MNKSVYEQVVEFKRRHHGTISWRTKAHCKVIEKHLNEPKIVRCSEVIVPLPWQTSHISSLEIFNTYVIAVTNKRLILAQKRVLFGYLFISITPDMFNDLTVSTGIVWGRVIIDTIKEIITVSNLSKGSVDEIETAIT